MGPGKRPSSSHATTAQLNPDVQQALQHAISKANNAATSSMTERLKKRKRKKNPKDMEEAEVEAIVDNSGPSTETAEDMDVNGISNKRPRIDAEEQPATQEQAKVGKKKKRKPAKEKQRAVSDTLASPDQLPVEHGISEQNAQAGNAFLSAVVTAAASTDQALAQNMPTPGFQLPSQYPLAAYTSLQAQHGQQPTFTLPYSSNFSISDLTAGANEEILSALQDMDLTKLTNALRTLGDATSGISTAFPLPGQAGMSASQIHSHMPLLSHTGHIGPSAVGRVPAPSSLILGQPPRNPPNPTLVARTSTVVGSEDSLENAHLLANKWMSASRLAELVKTKGLFYKKGKFSASEEQKVKEAIDRYCRTKGIGQEDLNAIIFAKGKAKDSAFWAEITAEVPQRPIIAVYHHVRRTHHPMKQQGKWMPAEDASLRQAVADLGLSWEKVSARVGRMASDCRDRWRNHINKREARLSGAWSKEEEDELTRIVTDMTVAQGKDADLDVFWTIVAEKMGNRRGRQQCRIKWTDSLSKTLKNEGQKPRWSQQDAYILVHKIASLNVRDDSEIDWKLLNDSDWNLWSAHTLQRRWLTLKRSIRGYEDMTHQEIMDILRVKKAQAPPSPAPVRKPRVTSSKIVLDGAREIEEGPVFASTELTDGFASISAAIPTIPVETETANEIGNTVAEEEDEPSPSSSSSSSSEEDSDDSSNSD